eukprot:5361031-Amphidinium_carterae.1
MRPRKYQNTEHVVKFEQTMRHGLHGSQDTLGRTAIRAIVFPQVAFYARAACMCLALNNYALVDEAN